MKRTLNGWENEGVQIDLICWTCGATVKEFWKTGPGGEATPEEIGKINALYLKPIEITIEEVQ